MNLNKIRIVLVGTTHPGNIGSACRAMKTMGVDRLYLVNPNLSPYRKAHEMASGAFDVLRKAVIVDTLPEALKGCKLICATSARPRDLSLPGLSPADFASLASTKDAETEIAVIFGRESSGLTNEELLQAHFHMNIPSVADFSSLNLSHSVQIVCYELRMKILSPKIEVETQPNEMASYENIERFHAHLEEVLVSLKFLKSANHQRILQKLRRLFNRTQLEDLEINILRGILTQIQNSI
ncbi:MAG: tRNA (cytosine(32)/uridine(32)-2'-O)-methyltransferase TrmJ [Legionellales bacterium RIFCSPHIGHO2_12_FULL_35_11]|nr:MAG: tRNA (cytosine(32)/uridine(32)-2'-O)-methyltransferase TrmJ [Legionellales bacterium RIFCSPHIGHO2_12_FULL_35_11]